MDKACRKKLAVGASKTEMKETTQVPAVEVSHLSKRYSAFTRGMRKSSPTKFLRSILGSSDKSIIALNGVTFSVQPKEVFGVLGPNGSGKTTFLKILSTLVIPDSGVALVHGIDVVKRPYKTSQMLQTVLTESTGLEKRITARQNLELFAALYNLPKKEADAKIDELLSYFGLTARANSMSQKFSTGMSRKLSVCRVLLSRASVVVFDEPTNGLDPVAASEFRQLLTSVLVKERDKTVILATHNLWEAEKVCGRIALFSKGRLLAIGTPDEIRKKVSDRVDLTMEIHTPSDVLTNALLERLRKLDGIRDVQASSNDVTELLKVSVQGASDIDYLGIFSIVDSLGLKITRLESSQPSLEEAFIKLTSEGED